jgi:hypothetical protein
MVDDVVDPVDVPGGLEGPSSWITTRQIDFPKFVKPMTECARRARRWV